jgi:hypothetical protein
MTLYHNQCYKCYRSTYYQNVNDGCNDFIGGANDDCGCSSECDSNNNDDDDD